MNKRMIGLALMLAAVLLLLPATAMASMGEVFESWCYNADRTDQVRVKFMITEESDEGNEVAIGTGSYTSPAVHQELTTSVVIPETVTYSGKTYSVTSIGVSAFWECRNLKTITLPSGITSIGDHAFEGCASMVLNQLPGAVASIGENAFYNCFGLALTEIPNSVTTIGENAFYGCQKLAIQTMPTGVGASQNVFSVCMGITSMTIPASISSIPVGTFQSCSNIKSLTFLGQTPPTIGNVAFQSIYPSAIYVPIGTKAVYEAVSGLPKSNIVERATISGTVNNLHQYPVSGAAVTLYSSAGLPVAKVTADKDGYYILPMKAERGVYTVFAEHNGYFGKHSVTVDGPSMGGHDVIIDDGLTLVGATALTLEEGYLATDPATTTAAYSIYGSSSASVTLSGSDDFVWNADAKTLTVKPGLTIQNGAAASYAVTVTATDGRFSDTLTFTVTVKPYTEKPSFITPAENQTVPFNDGQDIALTAAAKRASSYQWYVRTAPTGDFVPVPNANAATLNLKAVSKSQNGYAYRCKATNLMGSVDSPIFTLAVQSVPGDVPATGDAGSPGLWLMLLGLSLAGLGGAVWKERRQRQ